MEQQDCARELAINHVLGEACNLTTVALKTEAMEQLDDKDYVMSFPRLTKVQLQCGREEFRQLQGSYLVTVPLNCTVMTSKFTIVIENIKLHGQPIIITGTSYNFEQKYTSPHKLTLQSIDLRKLHNSYNEVMMERSIERNTTADVALYHTTVPFYVVLCGALTFALASISRRFKLCQRNRNISPRPDDQTTEPDISADFLATFSLKIGK